MSQTPTETLPKNPMRSTWYDKPYSELDYAQKLIKHLGVLPDETRIKGAPVAKKNEKVPYVSCDKKLSYPIVADILSLSPVPSLEPASLHFPKSHSTSGSSSYLHGAISRMDYSPFDCSAFLLLVCQSVRFEFHRQIQRISLQIWIL